MQLGKYELDQLYCIYIHIVPNNKVYIGMTQNIDKRFGKNGIYYRKCNLFYRAIQKYGWENIEHKVLFNNLTKEQAEQKEIEMIKKYKSNDSKYGYNILNGGNHSGKMDEKTRLKISQSLKKYNIEHRDEMLELRKRQAKSRIGIPFTEERKLKLKRNHKGNLGKKMSEENRLKLIARMTGKKVSDETRLKLSIVHKGKKGNFCKVISQYSLNGTYIKTYKSIKDASIETGEGYNHISNYLRGVTKSGKYKWKYAR